MNTLLIDQMDTAAYEAVVITKCVGFLTGGEPPQMCYAEEFGDCPAVFPKSSGNAWTVRDGLAAKYPDNVYIVVPCSVVSVEVQL